jgi:hypothetical protein
MNANFEFFDDDEEDSLRIDLAATQRGILQSMLRLNPYEEDEEETEVEVAGGHNIDKRILTFKVLVLDSTASSIVATIMKVGALRDCNVTLHLGLNQKREQIPDIPAVYLVRKKSVPNHNR